MQRNKLSLSQKLTIFVFMSIVPAIGIFIAYRLFSDNGLSNEQAGAYLQPAPSSTSLPLPEHSTSGDLTLYRFDAEIRQSQIYDILVDDERLWIGTGKGLLALTPDVRVVRHQQFGNAPFEWVQDLSLDAGLLAANVRVAERTVGGQEAGTHVFDTRFEAWQPIGGNVLDQAWLDGVLWQRPVSDRALVKTWQADGQWQHEVIPLQTKLCEEASMGIIDGEVWIAQQGTKRLGTVARARRVEPEPCGVIRYNPATGSEQFYEEGSGPSSGFGRDIAGDRDQVWVSHSIRYDRLSLLDVATQQWQSVRPYGTGNHIALSDRAVWLATPSSRDPFVRIDRVSQKRTNIPGVPAEFYVSAIAVDGDTIWLGLYKQVWEDSTYTIESYLAKYMDP